MFRLPVYKFDQPDKKIKYWDSSACYTPIHLCIFIGLKIANYETLESWQTLAVSKVDCFVLFPEFKRYFENCHHMDKKSIFKKSAD